MQTHTRLRHFLDRSIERSIELLPLGEAGNPRETSGSAYSIKGETAMSIRCPRTARVGNFVTSVSLTGDFTVSPPVITTIDLTRNSDTTPHVPFEFGLDALGLIDLFDVAVAIRSVARDLPAQSLAA